MVTSLTETSNQTNKSFYTNVFVLLFITKLYLKKFKQFCLGELLKYVQFKTFMKKNQKKKNIFISLIFMA